MSMWKLLGRLVKISPSDLWLITDESAGRLIYEKYAEDKSKSSENSQFFVVNYAKVFPRLKSEAEEIQGNIQLDLSNPDMVEPLTDD